MQEENTTVIMCNKLIRDRVPEIMDAQGKRFEVRTLDTAEYLESLRTKLGEELQEFLADGSLEELADLLEVVYAVAKAQGASVEQLESVRAEKARQRGGFDKRLYLIGVSE
jgi:predicted house-cleaning noncanonical NTP pyrophosphatase (MazG superfamily)